MEDADEEIDVDLFFILGLSDGTQHLQILKQVIGLIQQEAFVKAIQSATSAKEVMEKISAVVAEK